MARRGGVAPPTWSFGNSIAQAGALRIKIFRASDGVGCRDLGSPTALAVSRRSSPCMREPTLPFGPKAEGENGFWPFLELHPGSPWLPACGRVVEHVGPPDFSPIKSANTNLVSICLNLVKRANGAD